VTSVISFLFLVVASLTFYFCSLKLILFSFAQFVILFISKLQSFRLLGRFPPLLLLLDHQEMLWLWCVSNKSGYVAR